MKGEVHLNETRNWFHNNGEYRNSKTKRAVDMGMQI